MTYFDATIGTSTINLSDKRGLKWYTKKIHTFILALSVVSTHMTTVSCRPHEYHSKMMDKTMKQNKLRKLKNHNIHDKSSPRKIYRKLQVKPDDTDEEANNLFFDEIKFDVSLSDFEGGILEGYSECDDLIKDVEQALKYLSNQLIKEEMNFGYFFNYYYYYYFSEMDETFDLFEMDISIGFDATLESDITTSVDNTDIGEDSFGTNNQHEDVDEADIVKSDGTFVYAVYGTEIVVLDLLGNEIYRLDLTPIKDDIDEDESEKNDDDWGYYWGYYWGQTIKGLLLNENRLVAVLSTYSTLYNSEIIIIDIDADSGALSITERKSIVGEYKTLRMIDSSAHLVTLDYMNTWRFEENLRRWNPVYKDLSDTEYATLALDTAAKEIPIFASKIVGNVLAEKIPDKDNVTNTTFAADACSNIAQISSYHDLEDDAHPGSYRILSAFVKIISFDIPSGLEKPLNVSGAFVPTSYADVYTSQNMLILGGRGWAPTNYTDITYITAFKLSGPSAIPNAVGIIPGYTLNQFSFDYFDDHLRIATTTNEVWDFNANFGWDVISESSSQIVVAKFEDGALEIVGMLEGLGKTERIFAVRFLGTRAFVVTFRQTDPFYAIDLSVPEDPKMKGELKIPGFSNYLHPVEDDYIVAVGQDADENGFRLGLQVALFDVSDLNDPRQIAKHVIEGWSNSESQHDHHAFRYLPLSRKLILPVSWYPSGDTINFDFMSIFGEASSIDSFDGFHVFDINPDFESEGIEEGIELDFTVAHYSSEEPHLDCYGKSSLKPRSLVFNGDMMTLKGHTILGHDLGTGEKLYHEDLDAGYNVTDTVVCYEWWGWPARTSSTWSIWIEDILTTPIEDEESLFMQPFIVFFRAVQLFFLWIW